MSPLHQARISWSCLLPFQFNLKFSWPRPRLSQLTFHEPSHGVKLRLKRFKHGSGSAYPPVPAAQRGHQQCRNHQSSGGSAGVRGATAWLWRRVVSDCAFFRRSRASSPQAACSSAPEAVRQGALLYWLPSSQSLALLALPCSDLPRNVRASAAAVAATSHDCSPCTQQCMPAADARSAAFLATAPAQQSCFWPSAIALIQHVPMQRATAPSLPVNPAANSH